MTGWIWSLGFIYFTQRKHHGTVYDAVTQGGIRGFLPTVHTVMGNKRGKLCYRIALLFQMILCLHGSYFLLYVCWNDRKLTGAQQSSLGQVVFLEHCLVCGAQSKWSWLIVFHMLRTWWVPKSNRIHTVYTMYRDVEEGILALDLYRHISDSFRGFLVQWLGCFSNWGNSRQWASRRKWYKSKFSLIFLRINDLFLFC